MQTVYDIPGEPDMPHEIYDVNSYVILRNALMSVGFSKAADTIREDMAEESYRYWVRIAERRALQQERQDVLDMMVEFGLIPDYQMPDWLAEELKG